MILTDYVFLYLDSFFYLQLLIFVSYLPLIFIGQKIMVHYQALNLKTISIIWNLFMSFSSGIGGCIIIYDLLLQLQYISFEKHICNTKFCYSNENLSFVGWIYGITKSLEWIDTLLLVLQKKKVIFLHYYHHLITMFYCWIALYNTFYDCSSIYYAGINLIVHFIMYLYYALYAMGFRFKYTFIITSIQFIQMLIGILVCYYSFYCTTGYFSIRLFCAIMYLSYVILFGKLLFSKVKIE